MRTTAVADSLSSVLFGQVRQAVLTLVFTRPDEAFYLRQIARLTGKALGAVQRELAELTSAGILARQDIGIHAMYRVDPACPIYPELKSLITKTAGVAGVLRACLAPLHERIAWAFLFGSFARGEQNSQSDVDLMVVSDHLSLADLVTATKTAQTRIGREINPVLYRRDEFALKLASGHHFLNRVMEGDKIVLAGDLGELGTMAQERLAQATSAIQRRNPRTARRGRS